MVACRMQCTAAVAQRKSTVPAQPRGSSRSDTRSTASNRKDSVLAVSEDSPFLIDLWTALATRTNLSVQVAETEQAALNALVKYDIKTVVLDLRMRELRALELLGRFAGREPAPGFVLVSSGEPRAAEHMLRALGRRMMVRSCTSVPQICEAVSLAIDAGAPPSSAGITPAVLATLVSLERATCTITFDGTAEGSALFFHDGELVDARTADASGEEAATRLLGAAPTSFLIETACRAARSNMPRALHEILARAIGRQASGDSAGGVAPPRPSPSTSSPPSQSAIPVPRGADAPNITEEKQMALETVLQQLKEIKGYKASGIMHFTGEMLASDSVDPHINLAMVGATFNDIFRSAHEASKKIGLDACRETTIVTPKGIVVMACSGVDSKAHVHFIGILAADGNHSLMKMQISKLIDDVVGALV